MFDRGKLFSTESTLCAEFIVQPSLRNAAADDLPLKVMANVPSPFVATSRTIRSDVN
jgi:hypothetical protein